MLSPNKCELGVDNCSCNVSSVNRKWIGSGSESVAQSKLLIMMNKGDVFYGIRLKAPPHKVPVLCVPSPGKYNTYVVSQP